MELIDCFLRDGEKSGYYFRVAESNNEITGYVCYGPTPLTKNTWDIFWEAVSRDFQGQGIGGKLLQAAEKVIQKAGGGMILIETSSTPAYGKTRNFYFRQGYEEIARVPDFYEPGDDKLILRKKFG